VEGEFDLFPMLAEIAKKVSALPVAVHPPGGPPWSLRLQIAFLFPKLSKQQQKMNDGAKTETVATGATAEVMRLLA
jgi:hypothetical protein